MDYKILIKILLVVYIVSMPVVGSIPIQHYVAHSSFTCIYIISSLIVGILYDVVICLLLVVILLAWMYTKKPSSVDDIPVYVPQFPQVPQVPRVPQVLQEDVMIPGKTTKTLLFEDFNGYDAHRDSFASFEEF
jgi:hypothetical protein